MGFLQLVITTIRDPFDDVKVGRMGVGKLVAFKRVEEHTQVATGSKLVNQQLRVLPDPDEIGNVQNSDVFPSFFRRRCRNVGIVRVGDPDESAAWLALLIPFLFSPSINN